jgi:hypothetical protein
MLSEINKPPWVCSEMQQEINKIFIRPGLEILLNDVGLQRISPKCISLNNNNLTWLLFKMRSFSQKNGLLPTA